MTTANETITIEVSTKDLLVRRIQELEATMTKRNATIESLTARIEADGESPLIEAAHGKGYTAGWKACAKELIDTADGAARDLAKVRKEALRIYHGVSDV